MDRRTFIKASAAAGSLYLWGSSRALAQAGGAIRIGFLAPLTGAAASSGRELVDGWNLFWQQNGAKMGGRAVETVVEDDASNPDTALQKARRLVQQQGVAMLVGNVLANTGLAVAEYVKGTGTPYFMPVVAADDLTQRKRIPNVLRVAGFSASQMTRPLADWCRKQGYKRVVTFAQDYTFGHEQAGGFVQTFTEEGGTVAGQLWHPINTGDFSPYLGSLHDGAEYDPTTNRWTRIDDGPLSARYAPGSRGATPGLFVWGGATSDQDAVPPADDGALLVLPRS